MLERVETGTNPKSPDERIKTAFDLHARALAEATVYDMERGEIQKDPHYQAIVGLGKPVLPLILAESHLSYFPGFMLMQDITGENPVPETAIVNKTKMLDRWRAYLGLTPASNVTE